MIYTLLDSICSRIFILCFLSSYGFKEIVVNPSVKGLTWLARRLVAPSPGSPPLYSGSPSPSSLRPLAAAHRLLLVGNAWFQKLHQHRKSRACNKKKKKHQMRSSEQSPADSLGFLGYPSTRTVKPRIDEHCVSSPGWLPTSPRFSSQLRHSQ